MTDALGMPHDRLLDFLEVPVVVFDRTGQVLFSNRRAREDLAPIGESVIASGLFAPGFEMLDEAGGRLPGAELPSVRTLESGEVLTDFVMGVRTPGGSIIWLLVGTAPILDPDDGSITGAICTFVDISAQRAAQEALRASEERFRLLAENAADMMYRVRIGPSPSFEYVNPAVETVIGYTPEELYADLGLIFEIVHDDDVEAFRELVTVGVEDVSSIQMQMTRRGGMQIWTEHRVVPLRDAKGNITAIEGIARDVTQLKLNEAVLSHQALHDPLTGLPNRVLLLDRLEHALARIRRHASVLAVLYLDLDRFKTVNDNLGHEIGDRLLEFVAGRLQETLRPSDSVARLGGDEFAAVLPDLRDPHEATQIAERLLAAVAAPVDLGEGDLVITVSIGIAGAGDGGASAAELLRRADFAMYTAKDRGRARVESYESLTLTDGPVPGEGDGTAS